MRAMKDEPMSTQSRKGGIFHYDYQSAGRGGMRAGYFLLVPALAGLIAWGTLAPINAAAIASGEVVLNQDRKTIQHLEGGLIDEILIAEGKEVREGDPILVIRDVSQRTRINMLYEQLANARALQARLAAERDGKAEPVFAALEADIDLPSAKFQALRSTQVNLFMSRKTSLAAKIDLIKARKASAGEEIAGLTHQLTAIERRLELNARELQSIEDLYKQKLVTANRMMTLEREEAELDGEAGSLKANIARLKQQIAAADIEIIDLQTETRNAVMEELQTTELNIQELTHQMREMSDQLERTVIKAPVEGVVMDLQVHTKGAVVRPGDRILDIVPNDDRLIIEARLNPNDIDLVTAGTSVKVQLSAYKAKKVPRLDGRVLSVSADILSDPTNGERYFLTRVLVDDSILENLKADVALYPGMPAQVFFIAGERTVADYLLSPIANATYRAFREE